MSARTHNGSMIRFDCVCGEKIGIHPSRLGRIVCCPRCKRYLRPALHFVMAEPSVASNLTVQCRCGRFIVTEAKRVGKRAQCDACGQYVIMPQPVMRESDGGVIRIPPAALKKQLRKPRGERKRRRPPAGQPRGTAAKGRIRLRPGENICVSPECGALLPPGAKVCTTCGTNLLTGVAYQGPGPKGDPIGKWRSSS